MLLPTYIQSYQVFTCHSSSLFTILAPCCCMHPVQTFGDGLRGTLQTPHWPGHCTPLPQDVYRSHELEDPAVTHLGQDSPLFWLHSGVMNTQQNGCPSSHTGKNFYRPHLNSLCYILLLSHFSLSLSTFCSNEHALSYSIKMDTLPVSDI